MVNRRLDAADRAALRAGNVYVWEERSPTADAAGTGMERVGFPILSYPLNRRAGSTTPLASPFSTYFSTTAQDPATFLVQKEAVQTKATSNKLRGPAFE